MNSQNLSPLLLAQFDAAFGSARFAQQVGNLTA